MNLKIKGQEAKVWGLLLGQWNNKDALDLFSVFWTYEVKDAGRDGTRTEKEKIGVVDPASTPKNLLWDSSADGFGRKTEEKDQEMARTPSKSKKASIRSIPNSDSRGSERGRRTFSGLFTAKSDSV